LRYATDYHAPVLSHDVRTRLVTAPDGRYVDATLGGGGHARALLDALGPEGVVLGIDRDADALDSVMESLRTAGVPVAGVVLNKFDDRAQLSGDYSYSYYGHDDEYADYRLAAAEESVSA